MIAHVDVENVQPQVSLQNAEPGEGLRPLPPEDMRQPAKRHLLDQIRAILLASRVLRTIALFVCAGLVAVSLVFAWYAWFKLLPELWNWSFAQFSVKSVAGAVGVFFLALLPLYPPFAAILATGYVVGIYGDEAAEKLKRTLEQGSAQQASAEDELAKEDKTGLVPLLRYSRVQLEAYYEIGLTQTQRSFRYSIIAMWIGFVVIISGIVIRVVDLNGVGIRPLDTDVSTMIVVSGVVIEVISALFLWVYRSSIRQLTYFYNRQLYNHSVLMSQRIAATMTSADEVKKMIVEKLLDRSWTFEPDSLPSGKTLLSFRAGKE